MSVTTSAVSNLYSDIVADLLPFYSNRVLVPNPSIISTMYNLEGSVGNQVKIPVTNSYGTANVSIGDAQSILALSGTNHDFGPSNVILSVNKRGAASNVSLESIEDTGVGVVAQATATRIASSLAISTDTAAFRVMASGGETALTDLANVDVGMDGVASGDAVGDCEIALVFSPDAMAMAEKRSVEVKAFEDIDFDLIQYVGTVRNGFARPYSTFIRAVATKEGIGGTANVATLDSFSTSVANLRNVNAPTDALGFYNAVITPAQELALAKELNGLGASSGSIGSVAQDLANDALLNNLLTYAIGCRWIRSNNLPGGLASA